MVDLDVKPVINKNNKQINFSLPKKELPEKLVSDIMLGKKINIKIDEKLLKK